MGNVFLNFHSRVLCMNGLWGGWGPAAGRAGMDAGSQPLRGKDSQGGGRGNQCRHCHRFTCAEQEKEVALGGDLGVVFDLDMNEKFQEGEALLLEASLSIVKEKVILIPVKMIGKFLFRAITIGVLQQEREMGLISEYKDQWGFIAKEQGKGLSGWKITERRHQR